MSVKPERIAPPSHGVEQSLAREEEPRIRGALQRIRAKSRDQRSPSPGQLSIESQRPPVGCNSKGNRQVVARIVAHLAEIRRRKLYLDLGFGSVFDYCVRGLGLTEGSAYLRIQVANVCRRFPRLLSGLAAGTISLTVAGKLAPRLTADNHESLIESCSGMSKRQVEEYLTRTNPKPKVASGISRRPQLRESGNESSTYTAPSAQPVQAARSTPATSVGTLPLVSTPAPTSPPRPAVGPGRVEPCQPEVYNVRFPASQEFKDKLERFGEVIGVTNPHAQIAALLEQALDIALEKKDPQRRQERREKRAAKNPPKPRPDEATARIRTVPQPLRDKLLVRANHQCEYESPCGNRCTTRTQLTIDHVIPYARGGPTTLENLRVLCAAHNQRHAEHCYGREFMEAKIARARGSRVT